MIKAIPPVWPLFKLCLRIENMTGPTEMLSKSPRVIPLSNTSNITEKNTNRKILLRSEANDNGKNYFITILISGGTFIRLQIKTKVDHSSYKLIFICFYA